MTDSHPLRLLCVDDDPDILTLVEIGLTASGGFELRLCRSGREALAALADFTPDVALLDVAMADMDGPALLRALAARPQCRDIRAIFLTGAGRRARLAAAGGAAVIAKPFDPMTLGRRIAAIVAAEG